MIRLIHGDCREYLPIPADVVITDPPYGVDRNGRMLGQIASNYHEKGTHTRGYVDHRPERFRELLVPAFDGMFRSVDRGASLIAFCGNRTFHEMATIAAEAGWTMLDILVFRGGGSFAKSKTTLSPRHELAMWMRKPGGTRLVNPNRNITNVFDIPKSPVPGSTHDTPKPQAWMRRIVEVFSEEGQTILDPFSGSGSTLIAAEALGRNAVGIEREKDAVADALRLIASAREDAARRQ